MPEPLVSRSDAVMAQAAVRRGFNLSVEEREEIKQAALRLVRVDAKQKGALRAWARGAALGIAMESQDIKVANEEKRSERPAVPAVLIQADSVSFTPEDVRGILELERSRRRRPAPVVIENSPSLIGQAPKVLDGEQVGGQ